MDQEDYMMNYGGGPGDAAGDSASTNVAGLDPTIPAISSDPTDPTLPAPDPTMIDPTAVDPTEVAVKVRRPQVKLTAEKLMGPKGLPYVMKKAPKMIHISSKRKHAHDNLSKIIMFYHVWAHSLFPKAKFRDFVKLCNTLGKSDSVLRQYRMNLFRADMGIDPVDESTQVPGGQDGDLDTLGADDDEDIPGVDTGTPSLFVNQQNMDTSVGATASKPGNNIPGNLMDNNNEDDEDDDLFAMATLHSRNIIPAEMRGDSGTQLQTSLNSSTSQNANSTDNEELDILMRDIAGLIGSSGVKQTSNLQGKNANDYADDEAAMLEMEMEEDMIRATQAPPKSAAVPVTQNTTNQEINEYDDDEEAMLEMMRQEENETQNVALAKSVVSPVASGNNDTENSTTARFEQTNERQPEVTVQHTENGVEGSDRANIENLQLRDQEISANDGKVSNESQPTQTEDTASLNIDKTQSDELNGNSKKTIQNEHSTNESISQHTSHNSQEKSPAEEENFVEETMNAMDQYGF